MMSKKILFALSLILFITSCYNNQETNIDAFEKLRSLPYLTWNEIEYEISNKSGVTVNLKNNSFQEIYIYNYDGLNEAYLIDASGKRLHTWNFKNGVHHVEIYPNGDLLGINKDYRLVKLNWDSKIIWETNSRFHHDIDVAENGDIYSLTRNLTNISYDYFKLKKTAIVDDKITVLSPDGKIKKKISIFNLFGDHLKNNDLRLIDEYILEQESQGKKIEIKANTIFDVFHTNTIEMIDNNIEGLAKKGDVLVCIRNLNLIAIIDVEKEEVVWSMKNKNLLDNPHQPSLLDNGNILIFDNGRFRNYSRIVELNPFTQEIVWEYNAEPPRKFFSEIRGGVQKLPNGNNLVTESNKAHVFEVTSNGKIVWEFYDGKIKDGKTRAIYRMTFLENDEFKDIYARTS